MSNLPSLLFSLNRESATDFSRMVYSVVKVYSLFGLLKKIVPTGNSANQFFPAGGCSAVFGMIGCRSTTLSSFRWGIVILYILLESPQNSARAITHALF